MRTLGGGASEGLVSPTFTVYVGGWGLRTPSPPSKPEGQSASLDSAVGVLGCSPETGRGSDPGPERGAAEWVGEGRRPPAVRKDQKKGLLCRPALCHRRHTHINTPEDLSLSLRHTHEYIQMSNIHIRHKRASQGGIGKKA